MPGAPGTTRDLPRCPHRPPLATAGPHATTEQPGETAALTVSVQLALQRGPARPPRTYGGGTTTPKPQTPLSPRHKVATKRYLFRSEAAVPVFPRDPDPRELPGSRGAGRSGIMKASWCTAHSPLASGEPWEGLSDLTAPSARGWPAGLWVRPSPGLVPKGHLLLPYETRSFLSVWPSSAP